MIRVTEPQMSSEPWHCQPEGSAVAGPCSRLAARARPVGIGCRAGPVLSHGALAAALRQAAVQPGAAGSLGSRRHGTD